MKYVRLKLEKKTPQNKNMIEQLMFDENPDAFFPPGSGGGGGGSLASAAAVKKVILTPRRDVGGVAFMGVAVAPTDDGGGSPATAAAEPGYNLSAPSYEESTSWWGLPSVNNPEEARTFFDKGLGHARVGNWAKAHTFLKATIKHWSLMNVQGVKGEVYRKKLFSDGFHPLTGKGCQDKETKLLKKGERETGVTITATEQWRASTSLG